MVNWSIRFAATRQLDVFALAIVINDDIESQLEMWRMPTNISQKKAHAQADCYDPSRMKDHISSMFSLKEPNSNGRKTLCGTDRSRMDGGCLVKLKDCD
jgi:hypothetical protein